MSKFLFCKQNSKFSSMRVAANIFGSFLKFNKILIIRNIFFTIIEFLHGFSSMFLTKKNCILHYLIVKNDS